MSGRIPTRLLHVFAFLAPIYFIFYPPLHDTPRSLAASRLWRTTMAGFAFYAVAGSAYLITH